MGQLVRRGRRRGGADHRGSDLDSERSLVSLRRIEQVAARLILPGPGDPWTDGVPAAVAAARARGCR